MSWVLKCGVLTDYDIVTAMRELTPPSKKRCHKPAKFHKYEKPHMTVSGRLNFSGKQLASGNWLS